MDSDIADYRASGTGAKEIKMMHIDYAKECFLARETPKHSQPFTELQLTELFIHESEFLKLVDGLGDEKLSSIAATVRASANSRYEKVTANQKYALAAPLLKKYKTARAVYAAAFGVTEATMFGEPDPIEISATEKVWFSDGAQIACVVEVAENGAVTSVTVGGETCSSRMNASECYPASKRALANCKKSGMGTDILTVVIDGQIVILAIDEAKEHGIKETGLKKVDGKWVPDVE